MRLDDGMMGVCFWLCFGKTVLLSLLLSCAFGALALGLGCLVLFLYVVTIKMWLGEQQGGLGPAGASVCFVSLSFVLCRFLW